ncbi:iron-dependent peroxidase [Sporosarcina limicola]|uniref:Iron-dependent peroxidase n=1 Tax=Sporosarcina limicola TaxID=34101 RepID=A0A927RFW7_9BACL|nr:iron-dependent peroxidase [Sporosarcina limicola]MBE1555947.1 hypothetical protein [Sporosarcina limicola]
MNYIWDLLIKAENVGLYKKDIQFILATSYSPYMELSNEVINVKSVEKKVEVNPYYRYYEIFKDLFPPEDEGEVEFKNIFFDLVLHFLADIDLVQGMNKREYYLKFILKDIEAETFGYSVKDKMKWFTKEEKERIATNILRLYQTGEEIYLLKDTMRKLFKDCIIYLKCDVKDELLIYIGQEESEITQSKVDLILEIFLPIRFQTEIYWKQHFGIIDVEETMKLDRIALY